MGNSKRINAKINKLNKRKKNRVLLVELHWDMTRVEKAISIIQKALDEISLNVKSKS